MRVRVSIRGGETIVFLSSAGEVAHRLDEE